MRRGRWHGWLLVLGALGVLATVTATAGASGSVRVDVATNAALRTKIIVDSGGFTLYHYTRETKGKIDCSGLCEAAWVPLLAGSGKPVAGAGLSANKLSTIKRPASGGLQVTYNNYALYLYRGDKKPGQVNGQGSGGDWYAITPAGAITKHTTATVTTTSTIPSTTKTTSGTTGPATTTTSTTPSSGTTTTTSGDGGLAALTGPQVGCAPGQTIAQGADQAGVLGVNDDDGDNGNSGDGPPVDDGDGCY